MTTGSSVLIASRIIVVILLYQVAIISCNLSREWLIGNPDIRIHPGLFGKRTGEVEGIWDANSNDLLGESDDNMKRSFRHRMGISRGKRPALMGAYAQAFMKSKQKPSIQISPLFQK
ncbi:uncharacterized protein LOC142348132 [Convolutriloba macropyga]|uniref:uncharacterized protein LOC142348132 n=1 Tax=Convolutriloba macropyga TaxID=536237 RepID=UPI003F51B600